MACIVHGCKSNRNKISSLREDILFYRFPEDRKLRETWTKNIRLNRIPNRDALICGLHFAKSCYRMRGGVVSLRPNAVPTVFTFKYGNPHVENGIERERTSSTETCVTSDSDAPGNLESLLMKKLEAERAKVAELAEKNHVLEVQAKNMITKANGLDKKNRNLEMKLATLTKLSEDLAKRSLMVEKQNETLRMTLLNAGVRVDEEEDEGCGRPDHSGPSESDKEVDRTRDHLENPTEPKPYFLRDARRRKLPYENNAVQNSQRLKPSPNPKIRQMPSASPLKNSPPVANSSLGEVCVPINEIMPLDSSSHLMNTMDSEDPLSLISEDQIKLESVIEIEEHDLEDMLQSVQ